MTSKSNNKEKQSTNELKKYEKNGEVTSTPQAPLVTGYESVSLRIKTELMTARKCERLKRIAARDTRICQDYLRIIKHNEDKEILEDGELIQLIQKNGKVNKSLLDKLTLTTSERTSVPHDLKKRYPRCSHKEFQECRNKTIWTYESSRIQQELTEKELCIPQFKKKTPRCQLIDSDDTKNSFTLIPTPENSVAKLWLKMKDSLDSKRSGKRNHKRLSLPLAYSPYHEKKLILENIRTMELVYHSEERQWWAHFIQKFSVPQYHSTNPPAVLGVDLGMKKTAVAVLLTPRGKVIMDELCFIVNKERQAKMWRLNKKIQSIQRELDTRKKNNQPHNQLNVKLSHLRKRLRAVTTDELGYAVNQLVEFILPLKEQYNLFISVGYPKDIRNSHQRGSGNKSLRRQLHKWCYHLFITKLQYKLAKQGFDSYRVVAVHEGGTSRRCSRCFSTNTSRTSQGRFKCNKCKYELNADLNGARNIGKRLIKYALEPKEDYYTSIRDTLIGTFHSLTYYQCFKPLSQWLKYP